MHDSRRGYRRRVRCYLLLAVADGSVDGDDGY